MRTHVPGPNMQHSGDRLHCPSCGGHGHLGSSDERRVQVCPSSSEDVTNANWFSTAKRTKTRPACVRRRQAGGKQEASRRRMRESVMRSNACTLKRRDGNLEKQNEREHERERRAVALERKGGGCAVCEPEPGRCCGTVAPYHSLHPPMATGFPPCGLDPCRSGRHPPRTSQPPLSHPSSHQSPASASRRWRCCSSRCT